MSKTTFCFSVTVTLHVAVTPCNVLTVIVAVPAATAVTLPSSSTVATFLLEDVHSNVLFAGFTVAVSFDDVPSFNSIAALSNVIVTLLFLVYTESLSTVSPNTRTYTEFAGTRTDPLLSLIVTVLSTSVPASLSSIHTFHVPFDAPTSLLMKASLDEPDAL